jgi:hypothetical protein
MGKPAHNLLPLVQPTTVAIRNNSPRLSPRTFCAHWEHNGCHFDHTNGDSLMDHLVTPLLLARFQTRPMHTGPLEPHTSLLLRLL